MCRQYLFWSSFYIENLMEMILMKIGFHTYAKEGVPFFPFKIHLIYYNVYSMTHATLVNIIYMAGFHIWVKK
jgi:hypothetical protein